MARTVLVDKHGRDKLEGGKIQEERNFVCQFEDR